MRVATTRHGKKLHLLDHDKEKSWTGQEMMVPTICGVHRSGYLEIKRPKRGQTCQSCVKFMISRMARLVGVKPVKSPFRGKTRTRGSPSQVELKGVKGRGSRK